MQINFTTGKSGALEGAVGTVSFNPKFTITTISGGKLVDGTYAAPGAAGCGGIFSFLVDPLVNSILGLPAGRAKTPRPWKANSRTPTPQAVKASE